MMASLIPEVNNGDHQQKSLNSQEEEKEESHMKFDSVHSSFPKAINLVKYVFQKEHWPKEGKHILAQYDDKTVIVYQAFKPAIARYAVENQKFGGPEFSYDRMSWIKTNFLWMMYRCGWASKKNQERVLAVKISRYAFEVILANAYTAAFQKENNLQSYEIEVRLQWDPDHTPTYDKETRKAIQLGLKGEILKKYGSEWIHSITDITDFVKSQKKILDRDGKKELMTPLETVYSVQNAATVARIGLDIFDGQSVISAPVPKQDDGTKPSDIKVEDSKQWTCTRSECGNSNFHARKRCSKCNTPRAEYIPQSDSVGQSNFTAISSNIDDETTFKVPDDLHVPSGMITPSTKDENSIIEKTAKFVATNGIEMELSIKSKQGSNPKLSFMNLDDPLNYYYNHMVKMIKAGKYVPKDTDK